MPMPSSPSIAAAPRVGTPPAGVAFDAFAGALAELVGVFDDDEIVAWFGTSNCWLGGLAPAELAARAPHEVVQAARADRFVARGA